MKLTFNCNYVAGRLAPLYTTYNYHRPVLAYVQLGLDGRVLLGSALEEAWPWPAKCGRTRMYEIRDNAITAVGLDKLLDDITPLLQRVSDGMSIEWDGSDEIGILTPDAKIAEEEIAVILHDTPYPVASVYAAIDYLRHKVGLEDFGASSWKEVSVEQAEAVARSHNTMLLRIGGALDAMEHAERGTRW